MADNAPINVIRSHQDDRVSLASSRHEPTSTQSQPAPHADVDTDEKYNRDVPPDGGYGWVCVACVFWINAHTWGINSVSTFRVAMHQHFDSHPPSFRVMVFS